MSRAKKKPEPPNLFAERALTVAEYVELLNVALQRDEVRIIGEVTQVQRAVSGHVYFSLKDEQADAVLSCIVWKGNYFRSGIAIESGMRLVLTGTPSIYAPTGRFSFVAHTIELHGAGALKKAYDDLKKKLEAEGLFSDGRKRPLPVLPRRIGVVTSREGAVIHDFVNNLGRFGFIVDMVDSRVEGQQAVKPLIEAIHTLKKRDIEVLVVIRGGGSLESLQAFNNEALVREIAAFPVPVIAGIGHDKDVPLAALTADAMASTPTATAHLLNESWEDAYAKLGQVPHLLVRVKERLERMRTDLSLAWHAALDHTAETLRLAGESLKNAEQIIRLNDPTRQLKLGYAIVRKGSSIVRAASDVSVGEHFTAEVYNGTILARVEEKKDDKDI